VKSGDWPPTECHINAHISAVNQHNRHASSDDGSSSSMPHTNYMQHTSSKYLAIYDINN